MKAPRTTIDVHRLKRVAEKMKALKMLINKSQATKEERTKLIGDVINIEVWLDRIVVVE